MVSSGCGSFYTAVGPVAWHVQIDKGTGNHLPYRENYRGLKLILWGRVFLIEPAKESLGMIGL
jgi:hypothetical protein